MEGNGGYQEIKLNKSAEVVSLLEERNILDENIQQVIHHAEGTGEKLYNPDGDRYLARLEQTDATFYVEYSVADDVYSIHTAYFHRSKIEEDGE